MKQSNDKYKLAKVTRNTLKRNTVTLSQYFEKELLEETVATATKTTAAKQLPAITEKFDYSCGHTIMDNENDEIDIYTSYASYMSSSDPGSDNLLVTFDYGYQDSLDAADCLNLQQLELPDNSDDDVKNNLFRIPEEKSSEDLLRAKCDETYAKSPNIFKVHQIQHVDNNNDDIKNRASSCISLATSLIENNIDISGDYGSWAQCESEPEEGDSQVKTYRNYRYEDLIKNEVLIYDDDDGNAASNGNDDGKEVLINFNFDEDLPPRWFNTNEHLYYRSVDYLN